MAVKSKNIDLERLRSYSSIFSSTSFMDLLLYDDYTFIDDKLQRYDSSLIGKNINTYLDYIKYIYREMRKQYRNEYLYKNTFSSDVIIKKYGLKNTLAINEFRVGNSIADIVLFNGSSKAYEIKTELDSNIRLKGQLDDYKKIFNECYVITHESLVEKYLKEDYNIGVIQLVQRPRSIALEEVRPAHINEDIDVTTLMKSLRTSEYKNIVQAHLGELPQMNSFNMYNLCLEIMHEIPNKELNSLFLNEIKKRKSNTSIINKFHMELRQLCLAININEKKYEILNEKLSRTIKL